MFDFSKWKPATVATTSLLLDSSNPRLFEADGSQSQTDLIHLLLNKHKAYDLCRDIALQGYFPDSSLITVKEGRKHVVVEGNRRLAAVRALLNPELAPGSFTQRLRALQESIDLKLLAKLPVIEAPSRSDAAPLIIARHTEAKIEAWSPLMKAKFYRSLFDDGMDSQSIHARFGVPLQEVHEGLRRIELYEHIASVELAGAAAEWNDDPTKIPFTTIERVLDSAAGKEFLHATREEGKPEKYQVSQQDFREFLKRLSEDIAAKKVNTRKRLNTNSEIERFLKTYDKPKAARGRGIKTEPSKQQAKKRKTKKSSTSSVPRNLLNDINCLNDSPRVAAIFDELSRLSINSYPNAAAVLLRTLIDTAFLSRVPRDKTLLDYVRNQRKKESKADNWTPPLRRALRYVLDHEPDKLNLDGTELAAAQKWATDKASSETLDALDKYVHNPDILPTRETVYSEYVAVRSLLKQLLTALDQPDETTAN